jgi:hypothetical protein
MFRQLHRIVECARMTSGTTVALPAILIVFCCAASVGMSDDQSKDAELLKALNEVKAGKLTIAKLNLRFGPAIVDTDSCEPAPPIGAIDFVPLRPDEKLPAFAKASRVVYWGTSLEFEANPVVMGLVFYPDGKIEVFRAAILPP